MATSERLSPSQLADFRAVIDAGNVVHYAGRSAWNHEQLDQIAAERGIAPKSKAKAKADADDKAGDTAPDDTGTGADQPGDAGDTAPDADNAPDADTGETAPTAPAGQTGVAVIPGNKAAAGK